MGAGGVESGAVANVVEICATRWAGQAVPRAGVGVRGARRA